MHVSLYVYILAACIYLSLAACLSLSLDACISLCLAAYLSLSLAASLSLSFAASSSVTVVPLAVLHVGVELWCKLEAVPGRDCLHW